MTLEYVQFGAPITIKLDAEEVSMRQIGVLGTELHKLFNQVAIATIEEEIEIEFYSKKKG